MNHSQNINSNPLFNNDNTIIETIESVMKQVYSSIEMIIVNDGSTEQRKVITSYIEKKLPL
jgi:glycosyltransferase involved in cell wall biosynthesis